MKNIKCNYSIKLDKTLEPIAEVSSGETFCVETINAYGANFKNLSELMDLINGKYSDTHHHPLTGPIDIKEAKVGDVLKISIDKINIEIMGQALSQSAGINPITIQNFADRAPIIATYDEKTNDIAYMNGIHIDYKPMLGMIGTAPQDNFIKTGHAGQNGGNLDIPFIGENVCVYLPVSVDKGKLFVGDIHGNQGYGELGGIALEASSNIKMKVEVLKPRKSFNNIVVVGKEPLTNKEAIGIVGVANSFQNLNEAVKNAYINAIDVLQPIFPTLNEHYICNLITAIGHSMNGQAWSKTSESTSIINIFEDDIKKVKKDVTFSLRKNFDNIMFIRN
jgi:amidase